MRRSNAPTLQDVADGAGVSVMMASVVINGAQSSTRVAPATRQRKTPSPHPPCYETHATNPEPLPHNLDVDTVGGAVAIMRFLIQEGHRRIAHFPGSGETLGVLQRIEGYRLAIEEAGQDFDES